jgi:hypothetical protein
MQHGPWIADEQHGCEELVIIRHEMSKSKWQSGARYANKKLIATKENCDRLHSKQLGELFDASLVDKHIDLTLDNSTTHANIFCLSIDIDCAHTAITGS